MLLHLCYCFSFDLLFVLCVSCFVLCVSFSNWYYVVNHHIIIFFLIRGRTFHFPRHFSFFFQMLAPIRSNLYCRMIPRLFVMNNECNTGLEHDGHTFTFLLYFFFLFFTFFF